MNMRRTAKGEAKQPTIPRIGDMLVDAGFVTPDEVQSALEQQRRTGRRLGETLFEVGAISSFDLALVLADRQGVPFVDFDATPPEPDALAVVPVELARRYGAVALSITDNHLRVALANPADVYAIDDLESVTGFEVETVMADPAQLLEVLAQLDGDAPQVPRELTNQADRSRRPRTKAATATRESADLFVAELRRMQLAHAALRVPDAGTVTVDDLAMSLDRYLIAFVDGPDAEARLREAKDMHLDLYLLAARNVAVFLTDPRIDSGAHAYATPWPPEDPGRKAAIARLSRLERSLGQRLAGPATNSPRRDLADAELSTISNDIGTSLHAFVNALEPKYRSWFALDARAIFPDATSEAESDPTFW